MVEDLFSQFITATTTGLSEDEDTSRQAREVLVRLFGREMVIGLDVIRDQVRDALLLE
jgi:hypothetical protein